GKFLLTHTVFLLDPLSQTPWGINRSVINNYVPEIYGLHYLCHLSMSRSQSSNNHRYHTQYKGHQKCQVNTMQEGIERGRELPHATSIDEHMHHRHHRHCT